MKGLTLNRLRNTNFNDLFKNLAVGESLTQLEYKKLLSLAIIFINESDPNIFKLGYRIIVFYCNQTKDYKPLYDIALNKGLYPIVKTIEKNENYSSQIEESFFKLFQSSFGENYRSNNIYLSEQQKDLFTFFNENQEESVSVIAPTSYGKSELIISTIKRRKVGNVCIIVPTKALIAQTKRRIIEADIKNINKIITHPEMYLDTDKNITAVLTQERLLRLLRKKAELHFDLVFIDEAHNLLENNDRSILLASAISILEKRNSNVKFKFLTPFLMDSTNLSVRYTDYNPESFKITEYIKTERLYIYDARNEKKLKLYDQFLDEFFYSNEDAFIDDIDLILKKSGKKNIIYLNKPSDLEKFSSVFSLKLSKIRSDKINKACEHISSLLDPDYLLINCIEKGVIYHHGSVPDNIKMYIEHLYSELEEMRFVITSSTLLEGVNIPAATLFLLDNKKGNGNLSSAQFKNLIGRICRFSEVFSPVAGNLKNLEPCVYIIGSNYVSKKANLEKFIRTCMKVDKKEKDIPTNVLLKNVKIIPENSTKKETADEFIENFEPGIINNYDKSYAQTEIGKLCFANNITEIDIIANEQLMQKTVDLNRDINLNTTNGIFEYFSILFLPYIKETEINLRRLSFVESRNFYKMFLDWRIKSASYREMISSFIRYWKALEEKGENTDIYVGRWGDKIKNGFRPLWTDIRTKNHKERINLAIVRIKEEQDFLDNIFIKYIEVLNDLKFVQKDFYERIKYGTSDRSKITLIKNGLSLTLTNLLVSEYSEYLKIDNDLKTVVIKPKIIDKMKDNEENEILIYEVKYNTKIYSK
ncbi:ski2-like helicase [compost metagenome]